MSLYTRGRARRALIDTVSYRAISQVATILGYVVMVRGMTKEDFGVFNLLYSFIPVISTFASLGLEQTLRRYQPEYLRAGNRSAAAWLVRFVASARFGTNVILLSAMLLGWNYVAPLFKLLPLPGRVRDLLPAGAVVFPGAHPADLAGRQHAASLQRGVAGGAVGDQVDRVRTRGMAACHDDRQRHTRRDRRVRRCVRLPVSSVPQALRRPRYRRGLPARAGRTPSVAAIRGIQQLQRCRHPDADNEDRQLLHRGDHRPDVRRHLFVLYPPERDGGAAPAAQVVRQRGTAAVLCGARAPRRIESCPCIFHCS